MQSKLKIIIPIALVVVLAGVYKLVLAEPEKTAKPKVAGEVYVLPKEFLVNLTDGRFARLGVALVMEPGAHTAAADAGGHGSSSTPPDGYGSLPQEALVRDIVTDTVTSASGSQLISSRGRRQLKQEILEQIHKTTDVHADDVLFTDVAVQ
jgi:flagellar basal body-associated protein FliL